MAPPPAASPGHDPLRTWSGAGCAGVSLGLLLVLPTVTRSDASLGVPPAVGGPGWTLTAAVLVVQALVVVWAQRSPTIALPLLGALPLVLAVAAPGPAFSLTALAQLVGVLLGVLSRAPRRLPRMIAVSTVLLATGQFLNATRGGGPATAVAGLGAGLQALVVVGLPLLVGLVGVARREGREARDRELRALRGEQDALLAAAVARERTAMSRELHDIAAHHLSGIALAATAAERQITADPAAARATVRGIRDQSRSVLVDLRRLVGLLRDAGDSERPVAILEALEALVAARRDAGATVELRAPGGASALETRVGPLAQLVAYRMVQESLANAAAHAPGAHVAVTIDAEGDDEVVLDVHNRGPRRSGTAPAAGFGLVGMAERAHLVGARLDHGPTDDGGWSVRLALPVGDGLSRPEPTTEEEHR